MLGTNNDERNDDENQGKSHCEEINCCDDAQNNLVLIYEGEEFRNYLEYHVANYRLLKPDISIVLLHEITPSSPSLGSNNDISEGEYLIEQIKNTKSQPSTSSLSSSSWDGILFPAHLTGTLGSNQLWDWTEYLRQQQRQENNSNNNNGQNNENIRYEDIQPFFRSATTSIPLDGDVLSVYYRKDLFEKHQVAVPRTWDGYRDAASFFHGKPWGPNNTELTGSCVTRTNDCGNNINAYWASLVLSTMTQSTGTSSGFLLNPKTMDPLLGDAMEETLRILAEQNMLGPAEEIEENIDAKKCDGGNDNNNNNNHNDINLRLNEGLCAITYNWGNQLAGTVSNNSSSKYIGVAPTPGSTRVLNRTSGDLETCTPELCPYGIYYDDIGIVNRPSYSAFGGWAGGVSNDSSLWEQHAIADFFSYMSNPEQSLSDILPNQRSNFATPYRYSHVVSSNWTDAGYDETTASEYKDAIQEINSGNTVMEIRTPLGTNIREIIHEEVYSYLLNSNVNANTNKNISSASLDDATLRRKTTYRMDTRIRGALSSIDEQTITESYRTSLGFTNSPEGIVESMNFIDHDCRDTGWGLAGVICGTAVALIFWILWNRKIYVMQAFQPFLMIQCAMGLFFMGATLIPLAFDDSTFSREILDITCMVTPWMYMFGYTLFFSSVYSKILACLKIFKHPGKYSIMSVRPWDSLRLCAGLLLLNGIILLLWTFLDPLKWVRMEVTQDKIREATFSSDESVETYGTCMGEKGYNLGFAITLFVINMACCFIAIIQSFRCPLVLEYLEMQWLQLSILPLFETWIIGGPILMLVYENPTIKYIVFVSVITSSSIAIAFAVFAPKEWYVRKNKVMADKRIVNIPPIAPTVGVRVLKHPTVESQKHIVYLQNQRDHYTASNTELAIDIRLLQEKFRLLTEREKLAVVESMFAKEITDSQNSRINNISQEDEEFLSNSTIPPENLDILAVIDPYSATTWSMPADNGEEDSSTDDVAIAAGGAVLKRGTFDSSTKSRDEENRLQVEEFENGLPIQYIGTLGAEEVVPVGSTQVCSVNRNDESRKKKTEEVEAFNAKKNCVTKYEVDNYTSHPLGPSRPSDLVSDECDSSLHYVNKPLTQSNPPLHSSRYGDEVANEIDEITHEFNNQPKLRAVGSSLSSSQDETLNLSDETEVLNKMIESNDLRELETEISMMAAQFKLNNTFLESISDIQTENEETGGGSNKYDGLHYLDISNLSADGKKDNKGYATTSEAVISSSFRHKNDPEILTPENNIALTGISASAGESSSGEVVVSKRSPKNLNEGYSMQQHAGEPSSGDRPSPFKVQKVGVTVDVDDNTASNILNAPILERYKCPKTPSTECASSSQRLSTSPAIDSQLNQSQNNRSFSIADWTAVGTIGGFLADLSDTASTSSYAESSSVVDSISSLEVTISPSHLNIPLANEIDELLAQSDFDAVKSTAEKYEEASFIEEDGTHGTHNAKIFASRQKKRELEAMRLSFRRSDI